MSRNPEKKEMKTKPATTRESISAEEKSSSSEKAQVEKPETGERFCDNIINNVKDIKLGVLFASVENLFNRVRKLDTEITRNAKGLISRVTGYFRNSIDSPKKT